MDTFISATHTRTGRTIWFNANNITAILARDTGGCDVYTTASDHGQVVNENAEVLLHRLSEMEADRW